jgi:hypothetical protein
MSLRRGKEPCEGWFELARKGTRPRVKSTRCAHAGGKTYYSFRGTHVFDPDWLWEGTSRAVVGESRSRRRKEAPP